MVGPRFPPILQLDPSCNASKDVRRQRSIVVRRLSPGYLHRHEIDTVVPAPAPPPTSVEAFSPSANAAVFT